MKVFVAAIPRLTQRYSYVLDHLSKRTSMPIEIIGIDGTVLDRSGQNSDFLHNPSYPNPQLGCALSHVEAYKKIVDQQLAWALVVEDDIILPMNIDAITTKVASHLRDGEVISLYNPVMIKAEFSCHSAFNVMGSIILAPMDLQHIRTAAAYIIHHDAAVKLANGNDPVRFLADDFKSFYNEGWINFMRILHPSPCSVKPFKSSLIHYKDGSFSKIISDIFNQAPIISKLVTLRRRYLRKSHLRNIIITDKYSPFTQPNPCFKSDH